MCIRDRNIEKGKSFLEENAKRPGVVTLPSGLQYEVITEGNGKKPSATDRVKCHYEGTLILSLIHIYLLSCTEKPFEWQAPHSLQKHA